jgi:septum formation protein
MLAQLSGRCHTVVTGWVVMRPPDGSRAICGFTSSLVRMRELSRGEIRAYVEGGESLDKAGAYAVQGEGAKLVSGVSGSLDNVIGLPVAQVARALARFGIVPTTDARSAGPMNS